MLIRHFMSSPVFRVESTETIGRAWSQLEERGLRHVVVVRGNRALGVVTEHDFVSVLPRSGLIGALEAEAEVTNKPIASLLDGPLVSIGPNDHIDDAAVRMLEKHVDALPVIENGELVGILTSSDLFRLFATSSKREDSRRLSIEWPSNEPEPDPLRAVFAEGARLYGLVRHSTPGGNEVCVLHLSHGAFSSVQKRLVAMGYVVLELERARGTK
ncbi:MAG: CBS domain-containing protein [Planctomycetes bacterium]|nr:CBS domain-containing protein [Planctomycetota bacterium]